MGVIVADVVRLLDRLAIDLFALFHDLGGIRFAVFLGQDLFHRALEQPKIKAVVFARGGKGQSGYVGYGVAN